MVIASFAGNQIAPLPQLILILYYKLKVNVMKKESIMIGVDYEEFKPKTYKGVIIYDKGKVLHRFNTGNFNKDYEQAVKKAQRLVIEKGQHFGKNIFNSSSIDHYQMDKKKKQS